MQKYEILSPIGEGAYGVVLKCRNLETHEYVAIKKFKDSDEEQLTRKTTMRQVKILKLMSHPNIVEMKEAFRKKGIVFLVFQFVNNNLLQVLEKSPNGIKLSLIRKLMHQLLKGLAYLHKQSIIHRDIKLENLLVSAQNQLKICDFGFARQMKKFDQDVTDYVATRWYRAPQLLVGGQYGKEIDIWAVGCIMCQLIDGNPLFPGENQIDQLFLIQKSLGPLNSQLHERFIKNPIFVGTKFPQIQNLDPIDRRYFGKLCPKSLSLIKALLKMDPKQRMTAEQALNHPFFQNQRHRGATASHVQYRDQEQERKSVHTSTTTRKNNFQTAYSFQKRGRGNIFTKQKAQQTAAIYQSTNNCKLLKPRAPYQMKSLQRDLIKKPKILSIQRNTPQLNKQLHKNTLNWKKSGWQTPQLPTIILDGKKSQRKKGGKAGKGFNIKHINKV